MRNRKKVAYEIDFVPEPSEVFKFLQEKTGLPDKEAYYTWNMGLGYAIMAPAESGEAILRVAKEHGIEAWEIGTVVEGEKQVNIKPKGIIFTDDE